MLLSANFLSQLCFVDRQMQRQKVENEAKRRENPQEEQTEKPLSENFCHLGGVSN